MKVHLKNITRNSPNYQKYFCGPSLRITPETIWNSDRGDARELEKYQARDMKITYRPEIKLSLEKAK